MTDVRTESSASIPPPRHAAIVPVQSDPPWLRLGLLTVTVLSVALCALYFRTLPDPKPHLALALIPGLTVATFASAIVAFLGRRRAGALALQAGDGAVKLGLGDQSKTAIDLTRAFGATVLKDRESPQHLVLLTQSGREPIMLLDPAGRGAIPASWSDRIVEADLSTTPLSPATAGVLAVSVGGTVTPLLEVVSRALSRDTALIEWPLPSGETLTIRRDGASVGARGVHYRQTAVGASEASYQGARLGELPTVHGTVELLSLRGEDASILIANQEPIAGSEPSDGKSSSEIAPDAWLPPAVFVALTTLSGGTKSVAPGDAAR